MKYLIVGLGNPGQKYNNTYHNIGFKVVDMYALSKGLNISKKKGKSLIAETKIDKKKIIIAKPLTYMNLSGNSVSYLSNKYKIKKENILVICDDVDLDIGKIRFRINGGPGTHNGLKNIVQQLGDKNFCKLKIGIKSDKLSKVKTLDKFVLSRMSKQDEKVISDKKELLVDIIDEYIKSDNDLENKSWNE